MEARDGSKAVECAGKGTPGALYVWYIRTNVIGKGPKGAGGELSREASEQRPQAQHQQKGAKRAALPYPRLYRDAVEGFALHHQFMGVVGV